MLPKTIVIFGADSDTGYRLQKLLSEQGCSVVGVTRNERGVSYIKRLKLEIAIADPLDRDAVARVFADRDTTDLAVVCFIGGNPKLNTQGNINVIDAAADAGVLRIVLTTSIGCGDSSAAVDDWVKAFVGKSLRAKDWAENHLRMTAMDWTIVRAGGMIRRPGTGAPMLVDSPTVTGYINQEDLGDLVFQALQSDVTVHRTFSAVDRGRAHDVTGKPVVPAKL